MARVDRPDIGLTMADSADPVDAGAALTYTLTVEIGNAVVVGLGTGDGGFAADPPPADLAVEFSPEAQAALAAREDRIPGLRRFIVEMLRADPRPAYLSRSPERRSFGTRVFDVDVRWEFRGGAIRVTAVVG